MVEAKTSLAEFRQATERYSNWSRWGAEDQRGTLNYITRGTIAAALREGRSGKTFAWIPLDARVRSEGSSGGSIHSSS